VSAFAVSVRALFVSCGRTAGSTVVESCIVSVPAARGTESRPGSESMLGVVSAIAPPLVEESAAARDVGVAVVTA